LFITSLIGMAVFIYAMVSYTFSYLLLMDLRERIWPALEQSRQVVSRHWWRISGLVILLATLNVETYCLSGAMIQIVSGGLAFNWLCRLTRGTAKGRSSSSCHPSWTGSRRLCPHRGICGYLWIADRNHRSTPVSSVQLTLF